MTIKVRVGGANQTVSAAKIKVAGVARTITAIRVKVSGTLQTAYTAATGLAASASPTTVGGLSASGTVTTDATTVTPSGGVAPYSYAWTTVTSEGTAPTILQPAFASTAFRQTVGTFDEINAATFRCTVTDSLGATATVDVDAAFRHISGV